MRMTPKFQVIMFYYLWLNSLRFYIFNLYVQVFIEYLAWTKNAMLLKEYLFIFIYYVIRELQSVDNRGRLPVSFRKMT